MLLSKIKNKISQLNRYFASANIRGLVAVASKFMDFLEVTGGHKISMEHITLLKWLRKKYSLPLKKRKRR